MIAVTHEDQFWLDAEQVQALEDLDRERLDRINEYAGRDAAIEIESHEFETLGDRQARI